MFYLFVFILSICAQLAAAAPAGSAVPSTLSGARNMCSAGPGTCLPVLTGKNAKPIPDNYIVVYKAGVTSQQITQHQASISGSTVQVNDSMAGVTSSINLAGFKGYTLETDNLTLTQVRASPLIASIERDAVVNISYWVNQQTAAWPLQRVSHRFGGNSSYTFDNSAGAGTYTYILDTGIMTSHVEFGGRATWGANFVAGSPNADDNGHGTHCAGSVGSQTFGIAKKTNMIAVKVLDSTGAGSYSNVISGLQWTAMNAMQNGRLGRAVASLSLAGGYSAALNAAVDALYAIGIPVVVAAGNVGQDASAYSPASARSAMTVGATDSNDIRPWWSNYGPLLDIFAPGVDIQSTWNNCPTCVNTLSGTSMATPAVAGMLSYLISKNNLRSGSDAVRLLNYLAIEGTVKNAGNGSPNKLLFNGNGDNGW